MVHRNESVGVMVPAGLHSSSSRPWFAEYQWQKVLWAVRGPMVLLYESDGLVQDHAIPLLRSFLTFLTWAEKTEKPSFLLSWPTHCWKSAASITPASQLPVSPSCAPIAPFAFVLSSRVTKTRRAAVMDRTSSALAGFWWKAIWFPQPSYLMSL